MLRRVFLKRAGQSAAAATLRRVPALGAATEPIVQIRRVSSAPAVLVPTDFIGLGYEMSSAARPGLLSAGNARYVQLLGNLGPSGVLRCGGIVADYTSYERNGAVVTEPKHTVVTRRSLVQLRAFLDRVGWRAIWSVNFGRGTLAEATAEARDVAGVLGDRLLALELGNEVENYGKGSRPLRSPPFDFAAYRAEYARWHVALVAEVPGLRFAAPDTADSVEWVERMAADAHGSVQLLTTHYYRGGQQQATPEQLRLPDPGLPAELQRLGEASRRSGIPWRMCEINSFFGGGRPGISDTLLGALWTLDTMLLLASSGCAGVNMETGVNQLGFVSSYSPIQDDGRGVNSAGAPYYGMLAFAQALRAGGQAMALSFAPAPGGFTAYALGRGGQPTALVVVNRSPAAAVTVSFADLGLTRIKVLLLKGSEELSGAGLTLGGAGITTEGTWRPAESSPVPAAPFTVEPMSAVVLVSTAV